MSCACNKNTAQIPLNVQQITVGKIAASIPTDVYVISENQSTKRKIAFLTTTDSSGLVVWDTSLVLFMDSYQYDVSIVDINDLPLPFTIGSTVVSCVTIKPVKIVGVMNNEVVLSL